MPSIKKKAASLLAILILISSLLFTVWEDTGEEKWIHCSLDDTLWIFKDLTDNSDVYETIFDNPIIGWMYEMHEEYGAVFTCYCYYESWYDFSLNETTDKWKEDFKSNSDWLRFGFHGWGTEKDGTDKTYDNISPEEAINDYNKVISELIRIAGSESVDRVIRMSRFEGSREVICALKACDYGIVGLLGADSPDRKSYYLNDELSAWLFEHDKYYDEKNGLIIWSTDLRLENDSDVIEEKLDDFKNINNNEQALICFTHEWIFLDEQQSDSVKRNFETIFEMKMKENWRFAYPEEILKESDNEINRGYSVFYKA